MATPKQERIILEIQKLIDSLESQMQEKLPKIFSQLAEETIDIVSDLSLNPDERAENLRAIIGMKRKIGDALVNNPLYLKGVSEIISGYEKLARLSDDYIGEIIDNYSRKQDLYEAILRTNIDITKNNLLGAGIKDNFSNAIREVLKANIAGQSDASELRKVLQKFIKGSETEKAFLERYITQVTNDSLMTFNREYLQTISEDLDIQYYRYSGTVIKDSRPFCVVRAGKLYTKAQVESWASLSHWQGRMPGTTKTTIFSYCGGYNCKHQLWPASESQYNQAKKKGRTED